MKFIKIVLLVIAVLCALPNFAQQHQKGKATYYSKKATGAKTASGEKLHHDSLTCAHRFYPFGTFLKVTNLANDKSVVVKVTDRGPFGRGKIIDLSWGAAKEIGMLAQGVASVKVEVIDTPIPMRPSDEYELPLVDFEVAEAGYSFIDEWKEREIEQQAKQHKVTPKKTVQPKTKDNKVKPTIANHTQPKTVEKKEEKKTNSWRNVFDKIKNWGEDLF